MEKLNSYAEKQAEKAESLSFCRGMKLLHIRDTVVEMLDQIGKNEIFNEYTVHSIKHVDEMLKIVEWLIPDNTKNRMTYAEWLMLTLSIYYHDLGMVVTRDEYDQRNENKNYLDYKNRVLQETATVEYTNLASKDDHFLYQEFVRENHAARIRNWIRGTDKGEVDGVNNVRETIEGSLSNIDEMFKADLAMICESHHKDDIEDFTKYKVKKMYGSEDNEKVNLSYIAIILRVADLLHITRDRTPSITRNLINIRNPVSVLEWEKQEAVRAVRPKDQRNEEGEVDESIPKDTIEITAYFNSADKAEAYFGLSSYLQYTRKELLKCFEIVEKAQKKEGTVGYEFPWREIDESQIEVIGFEKKKLQFTIAQDNILQLLVGHTLYNDSSVVVRELAQNGIDAVRLQKEYDKLGRVATNQGAVWVEWDSQKRQLSFWDNGTGMTIHDVENYLLKVGASKYKDDDIKKQFPNFCSISHFGIGLLTCFMVADDIDIVTKSADYDEANSINLRKVNGSYLLRKMPKSELDDRIKEHGTMVKLFVRSDIDMKTLESDLQKWIINPEVPVFLTIDNNKEKRIGKDTLKEVLVSFLKEEGYEVDGKNIDVQEKTQENVTVAYAVRYSKYISDWRLMEFYSKSKKERQMIPAIGTCVEGVRVEFSTPGYKNRPFLAIANIRNSKYQTNVARSAIELGSSNEILSNIYDVYRMHIETQMDELEKQNYAHSWAMSEGYYLMKPLLDDYDYHNERSQPLNEEVLVQRLALLKCLALENNSKRKIISARDAVDLDEINIFECEMTRAGEKLLKEVRSDATLSSIISTVCEDNFLKETKNVICAISEYNILHRYALRNKEVKKIKVAYDQRRIQLTYAKSNDSWYEFEFKGSSRERKLFIPKGEAVIEGLREEVGVKAFGGIYLQGGTELSRFIERFITTVQRDISNKEESTRLLEAFFSIIFESGVLEIEHKQEDDVRRIFEKYSENARIRLSNEMWTEVFRFISSEELANVILKKNHILYSIENWLRSI